MTDRATQLREALDGLVISGNAGDRHSLRADRLLILADAARTIALPILEQDQELVERITEVLFATRRNRRIKRSVWFTLQAKAVLAALVPTEAPE